MAVALGLGAVYGFLALEAGLPVANVLFIWAVMTLFWAWSLLPSAQILGSAGVGFLVGFAGVWGAVLGRQLVTCRPPSCQTADLPTDLLYGFVFPAPIYFLSAGAIGLRHLMRGRVSGGTDDRPAV